MCFIILIHVVPPTWILSRWPFSLITPNEWRQNVILLFWVCVWVNKFFERNVGLNAHNRAWGRNKLAVPFFIVHFGPLNALIYLRAWLRITHWGSPRLVWSRVGFSIRGFWEDLGSLGGSNALLILWDLFLDLLNFSDIIIHNGWNFIDHRGFKLLAVCVAGIWSHWWPVLLNNTYVLINVKKDLLNNFHDTAVWSGFQAKSSWWKLSIWETLPHLLPKTATTAPIGNIVVGGCCSRNTWFVEECLLRKMTGVSQGRSPLVLVNNWSLSHLVHLGENRLDASLGRDSWLLWLGSSLYSRGFDCLRLWWVG